MENEIDKLVLDIDVKGKDSGKDVDKLATAILRLNTALDKTNLANIENGFKKLTTSIKPFVTEIAKVKDALIALGNLSKSVKLDKLETTTKKIKVEKETTEETKSSGSDLPAETDVNFKPMEELTASVDSNLMNINNKYDLLKAKLQIVNDSLKNIKLTEKEMLSLKTQQLSLQEQIKNTTKDTNNATKKTSGPLTKLLKAFGRISVYRAVRSVIKDISQAFRDSVGAITSVNKEFRGTMGTIQSDLAKVKASLGVAFYQSLIVVQPLISSISNSIIEMSNSFAKVIANMRGVGEYTKINTKYMKDYQGAVKGALLSFDTFETLSSGDGADYSKMLEVGTDSLEELSESEDSLKNLLGVIGDITSGFKDMWNDIKPSLEPILVVIRGIVSGFGKLVSWLKDNNLLTPALMGVLGLFVAIKSPLLAVVAGVSLFISKFKELSTTGKIVIPILATIAAAAAAIFTPGGAIIRATAAALTASAILSTGAMIGAKQFAEGGMIENSFKGTGTMYAVAGEAGAEIVARGSSGTGVANVEQIAEANYRGTLRALHDYGAMKDKDLTISTDRLGTDIARSQGFRNEVNRRNAGLNLI